MNVDEYGIVFRFSTGYDMSGFTSLTITFTKPSEAELVVINPSVTVGSVDIMTSLGTFLAGQYVNYTFAPGDVDEKGQWAAWLTYVDSDKRLISDIGTFIVNE